ncbi:glycosyltransferase [Robiginitalea marina]|uniref:Glycosyltransferase n=1 Tax=Robiginitalea marina TaxID=2954105 RepID=A0ABT1AZZ0_9FLAO|nr:glycosyltransferase [Robiginitalea marina]MCO5725264.1 glycosyltransferase [Robiginitalea marina]
MQNNHLIEQPSRNERRVIRGMVLLGVLSVAHFGYWLFQPTYRGDALIFSLLGIIFGYGMLRNLYLWYHYIDISVPRPPADEVRFQVDIFTTYFPGEPLEMVENTLLAIQKIRYPHTTYLCDEANDPYLKNRCKALGVIHVTRNNRKDAKAGNINNALRQATGEICLILDPDHVPSPDFLDWVLPHFTDPEVGFVQVVQSYSNNRHSLVARGAAEQTYQFYGPMMMTMNSYGTVNAIGANCTFRRKALDSIGGHAPGLAEDMHTAMQLHARGWKSVYVPKILARGLAPDTLGAFFKQQLKWSRGSFELLFRVYPRLFRQFSWRQKIHYALLPLHFLVGFIYLLSFAIPILSLLLSKTPWTGNIFLFLIAMLPIAMSSLLIRAYIQKWVMEKEERGFHLIGGLLQINTWWVHLLGFVFSIFNKKVPYLPTPKEGEARTNLRIVVPNILMGLLSIFAIIYGLQRDLTPFSLVMAGFALLNAIFMFFGVYLATRVTNANKILRTYLAGEMVHFLVRVKWAAQILATRIFFITRKAALPVLLLTAISTGYLLDRFFLHQWEGIPVHEVTQAGPYYSGIFYPNSPGGIPDLEAIRALENEQQVDFDLISLYLAWGDGALQEMPDSLIRQIYGKGSWPLITWEPWTSSFRSTDSIPGLRENRGVFAAILNGVFDGYIDHIATRLGSYRAPVFLRFAHEFDNPAYPWSASGGNTPGEFVEAWRYVHRRFAAQGAENVIWVWNPYRPGQVERYFPGEAYVDWIGVTGLNYGSLNPDGGWYSFDALYQPFHESFGRWAQLPVMIAEMGSLNSGGDRKEWLSDAYESIKHDFPAVKAWIVFHSQWDGNIPRGAGYTGQFLDWTGPLELPEHTSEKDFYREVSYGPERSQKKPGPPYRALPMPEEPIRGVNYKKGQDWTRSYYSLTRNTLQTDFDQMKKAGINTLRIQGPTIYDHNLLQLSREAGLRVIYSFWIPENLDFHGDQEALEDLKQQMLQTIERHRENKHILAWNLGNPTWSRLSENIPRPELDLQQEAFLEWFSGVCRSIKEKDPDRLLFADVIPSERTGYIDFIQQNVLPIDALGIIAATNEPLQASLLRLQNEGIACFIADAPVAAMSGWDPPHFVVRSWQDQWEADLVTFDGLLDHRGRKRPGYFTLSQQWGGQPRHEVAARIAIQRPAVAVFKGSKVRYHAKRYSNGAWGDVQDDRQEDFEWYLIKQNAHNQDLAIKFLGTGTSMAVMIPEEYEHYDLMLSYKGNGMVISDRKGLNLPLSGYLKKEATP